MNTGTSFFHALSTANMSRLSAEIADLQAQVSSGKKDPRPSADLTNALRLSAAREQDEALSKYASNAARAQSRLDQTDIVLGEATDIMRRIEELALTAFNDTTPQSERASIASEIRVLRTSLLGSANARDETGRALFGGFSTNADPFVDGVDGVSFVGDAGQPDLQVSESMRLRTGANGQDVFQPGTQNGAFEAIDSLLTLLETDVAAPAEATGEGALNLTFDTSREPQDWTFSLAGPGGTVEIEVTLADGATGSAVDAINARSAETGVTATIDPTTGALSLSAAGTISVSDMAREDGAPGALATATEPGEPPQPIVSSADTRDGVLDRLKEARSTFIDQRTEVGALAANASRQTDVITSRQTDMDLAISGLEDLDLAAALTRLQQLLLTRDASQQTYAKITQQTLFDYIR